MEDRTQYLIEDGEIELNADRRTLTLSVANTGDRPVQVGSHAHFFEVNRSLRFGRAAAFGMRLDIPAGTAIRFEPGQEHTVTLVELAGSRLAHGMNALTEGDTTGPDVRARALGRAISRGFVPVEEAAG